MESVKSDIEKEITTILEDEIKDAVNEASQGKEIMNLVNNCVLNFVDFTQFKVLNDPAVNICFIDVSEDDCRKIVK